jgi:hypothetical protein
MLDTIGGGDGRPWRRGTRLAPELDRRLAGDEPLDEIIGWWNDSWRAAIRLRKVFPHGDENVQPKNFSDNELAAFVINITSGCGIDDRGATLHWLWPMLGFDGARMSDAAYAETVRDKYWTQLENARAALRN